MFTLQRLLVAILAAVAGASLYAQTDWLEAAKSARQLPTETFIGSPDVRQPRLSPDGSKIALLFPHEGKMALGLFDRSSLPDGAVVARVNVRNRGIASIYTIARRVRHSNLITDQQGRLRFRVIFEKMEGAMVNTWQHRPDDKSGWAHVAQFPMNPYAEMWTPLFFNRDGRFLYVLSREENDRGAVHVFDTDTLTLGPALFVSPEGEAVSVVASRDGYTVRGVVYESDKAHYHWFEEGADRAKLQASIEAAFPGMEITFMSFSDDEKVALIHVGSDREAGVYFVLDRSAGSLVQFNRVREVPTPLMRPMEPIQFISRDGLTIHGYLTRPWTAESGQPVPMIVNPHGRPFGVRDSWGFNSEVQFLASRGYAVLQINYRGSGGYGQDYVGKGARQWGREMQHDLTDGVKWAIAEGIADEDRVAIYGASYGGYATLAGLTLTPELYACGINYVGASDLEITFKNRGADAFMNSKDYDGRDIWVGATQEYRDATSPVNLVANIQVPSFHAFGQKDPRVVIDHWERLEPELKKHGKIYESMVEKKQGHGFRDAETSVGFCGRVEPFLAKYLTPEVDIQIGESEVMQMPAM